MRLHLFGRPDSVDEFVVFLPPIVVQRLLIACRRVVSALTKLVYEGLGLRTL